MILNLTQITEDVFRQQTNDACGKFREGAIIFHRDNKDLNKEKLLKYTDALLFKFTISIINLEFLWKVAENKNGKNVDNNSKDKFEWNNANSIIDATFFESTIIQIRAFIDFSQKLSFITLGNTKPIDGTKDFYKKLNKIGNNKSQRIEKLFHDVDNSWGKKVRELRDKMVHYHFIKTNHEYRPKIGGENYERFAQDLSNEMFGFFIELFEILFEMKWLPGTVEEFSIKN